MQSSVLAVTFTQNFFKSLYIVAKRKLIATMSGTAVTAIPDGSENKATNSEMEMGKHDASQLDELAVETIADRIVENEADVLEGQEQTDKEEEITAVVEQTGGLEGSANPETEVDVEVPKAIEAGEVADGQQVQTGSPMVLDGGSVTTERGEHGTNSQVDLVAPVSVISEHPPPLEVDNKSPEPAMPNVRSDRSSSRKESVQKGPQPTDSFGFFNKLPGLRGASSSAEAGKGAKDPGPAVSANAREIMKGAERLQETAKNALSNFFSNTSFGLSDTHYDKVPLVDIPVSNKPSGGSRGNGVSQFGTMWKQMASLPLTGVGASSSLGIGSVKNPSNIKTPPGVRTQPPTTEAVTLSKDAGTGSRSADVSENIPLKSDGSAGKLAKDSASEQKGEASVSDLVSGLTHSNSRAAVEEEEKMTIKAEAIQSKDPLQGNSSGVGAAAAGKGTFELLTQNIVDGSRTSLKALQTKARHMVSQNKRRYQEGGFDLDMTYITESIIAMGFPGGDISSGIVGYVEGFYRNHMEDVIRCLETNHKEKYKVYNLCAERLYDAALFEGKVASFPFEDHNCPPLSMMMAFCESCYDWLKGGLDRVVVVHCKAGMARTGLMICCFLLYTKIFSSVEQTMDFYNAKRTTDGKALVIPSQLRYVHYFYRILNEFDSVTPPPRKCILRGIRLHKCPYWLRPGITITNHSGVVFSSRRHPRTKNLLPEGIWHSPPRKGVVVFALPGERCVTEIAGDFKITFQDRHGDFHCWLNTTMMPARLLLGTNELDGFEKRRLGSPGFQVEVVVLDHDAPLPTKLKPPTPLTPEKPSVPIKPTGPQGPGVLSAAASATVNAFQAFVGGGNTVIEKTEKKGGSVTGEVPSSSGKGALLTEGSDTAVNSSQSSKATTGMLGLEHSTFGNNDDIFSDSDEEKEEVKEKDKGKEAEGHGEQKGLGETAGPVPGIASGALGLFANALTSSVKDFGDGFNAMGGASLRSAMDSFRMGGPTASNSSGANLPAQDMSVSDEKKSTALLRGTSGSQSVEGLRQRNHISEPGGGDLQREKDHLGVFANTEGSTNEGGGKEGALGKVDPIQLPTETQVKEEPDPSPSSDFKALAAANSADMSVFTFGDDEDFDDDDE